MHCIDLSVGAATSSSVLQRHQILCSVTFFVRMHPAVKFFQRFQSGLIADMISSPVWTLAGTTSTPTSYLRSALLSAKSSLRQKRCRLHTSSRGRTTNVVSWGLFPELFLWLVPSLRVFAQQQCRWTDPGRCCSGTPTRRLWRERLLLHDLRNGSFAILTPDEDVYMEDLSRAGLVTVSHIDLADHGTRMSN